MAAGRAGSRRDHERFCRTEGWAEVRNARGKTVRHHATYELVLPDGTTLRTRISRPPDGETYGPALWDHVLRDQLQVSEEAFWACVDDGVRPPRSSAAEPPPTALPLGLVHQLTTVLHLTPEQVAALDVATAVRLLEEHWSKPR